MLSVKRQPFCLSPNVLTKMSQMIAFPSLIVAWRFSTWQRTLVSIGSGNGLLPGSTLIETQFIQVNVYCSLYIVACSLQNGSHYGFFGLQWSCINFSEQMMIFKMPHIF